MCGIAGFFNPYMDYKANEPKWKHILEDMNRAQYLSELSVRAGTCKARDHRPGNGASAHDPQVTEP